MPVATSAKKAVLIGVCAKPYKDFSDVPGALEDVAKLRELLITTYQYHSNDITVLVDKDPSTESKPFKADNLPTTENILEAMRTLVVGRQPGDHIFFAFSGHGSQVDPENDKNEIDGKDEILIPCDFDGDTKSGPRSKHPRYIVDDEIREIFVDQLQEGVHCTLLFDCCHSGTASDLLEVPSSVGVNGKGNGVRKDKGSLSMSGARGFTVKESVNHKHVSGEPVERDLVSQATGLVSTKKVTSWSACTDAQDSFGGPNGGKFIDAFVEILKNSNGKKITNGDLLLSIRDSLEDLFQKTNAKRQARSRPGDPLVIPLPQLGSLRPNSILAEVFTL